MSQMFVTLPSNSSMHYFPNNTLTQYRTRLEKSLDLTEGEWEVGLWEIQFPKSLRNVMTDAEGRMRVFHGGEGQEEVTEHWLGMGYYSDPDSLVRALNSVLKPHVRFKWNRVKARVQVSITQGKRMLLPAQLAQMLGVPRLIVCASGEEVYGREISDVCRHPHSMYVYCDLVQHQRVGDSMVPLLRIVPLSGKSGTIVTRAYENVQYLPAKGGHWESIEIDIRDDTGVPIPFESGKVWMTLHLRRVVSPYFAN